jgi:hypothetical protein
MPDPLTKADLNEALEATKTDLNEALEAAITRMERFVLDREIGMLWKFLLLGLTLLGAQWAAISWMMAHWRI